MFSILSDRVRTSVNVLGDCIGAGIVHHLNRDHLDTFEGNEETFGNDAKRSVSNYTNYSSLHFTTAEQSHSPQHGGGKENHSVAIEITPPAREVTNTGFEE